MALEIYSFPWRDGNKTVTMYVGTDAELPSTDLVEGDFLYASDSNKLYTALTATTKQSVNATAIDADLGAQTVTAAATDITAARLTTTQSAIDNIIADLNDLKAKMRTAGLLAT